MESDNKSGDAAVVVGGDGSGAAGGRLLVEDDESCWDVQNDRKRFQIDLKQGETTIVSWTKLLKDAGIPVDQSPPPSPKPPKRFHQEDESRSECSNIILKKETDEQKNLPQKLRTAISEVLEGINVVQATKNTKMGHARVKSTTDQIQNYDNRKQTLFSVTSSMKDPSDTGIKSGSPSGMTLDRAATSAESQSITLTSNNARIELPDLNVPYTVQAASTSTMHIKEESGGKVNGSMLESSILEMETMVAKSRRLSGDVQDANHSVATKSRLPQELKQKLETVARLAHSSQGRISDELIMRLMSILGCWLKPRTLKRCLRDMVPDDLSSFRWDAVKFRRIKKEVAEMIRLRTLSMEMKKKDPDGIENRYYDLLLVPICICIVSTILDLRSPKSNYSRLGRGVGLVLQGTWFIQMGLSFYSNLISHGCFIREKSRGNFTIRCKEYPEFHRARAIATLQFNVHLALLVCFIAGVYSFVSRKHGVNNESMQYKPLGAKMQHLDLDQSQFTLDSEDDEDDHGGV